MSATQHTPKPLPGEVPPVQDPDPFRPPAPVDDPVTPAPSPRDPREPEPVRDPEPKP